MCIRDRSFPVFSQSLRLALNILQLIGKLEFQIKNRPLKRHHIGGRLLLVHAKELKIPAEIENVKLILIVSVHQPRAEPGSPSNHLPEF